MQKLMAACFIWFVPLIAVADGPKVGAPYEWPQVSKWLDEPADADDAKGNVVVHWFCSATDACKTDFARLYHLQQTVKVYVIAYIDGTKAHAKRLNPAMEQPEVGATALGPEAKALAKRYGFGKGPGAIVADHHGVVALLAGGSDAELDARDNKIKELSAAIADYQLIAKGPAAVKIGLPFELTLDLQLSSWAMWQADHNLALSLAGPSNIACDPPAKIRVTRSGLQLRAQISCRVAEIGAYKIDGDVKFSYKTNAAARVGAGSVHWTVNIVP